MNGRRNPRRGSSACPNGPCIAAPLRAIGRQRHPLDVAGMRDRGPPFPRAGSGPRPRPRLPARSAVLLRGRRRIFPSPLRVRPYDVWTRAASSRFQVIGAIPARAVEFLDISFHFLPSSPVPSAVRRAYALENGFWPCSNDSRAVPSSASRCRGSSYQRDHRRPRSLGRQSRDNQGFTRVVGIGRGPDHSNESRRYCHRNREPDQTWCLGSRALLSRNLVRVAGE